MQWQWRTDNVPGDPWANMAADAALFESLIRAEIQTPIVRVYGWDRPCVSIGRLQEETAVRREFPKMPLVRRPTGGRAVVHGEDLTFAVMTRSEWLPSADRHGVLASYRVIVGGLVDALGALGISAGLGIAEPKRTPRSGPMSVRCFDTVASCDVADRRTGRKLIGSAQRRDGGVVLQQMTVPISPLGDPRHFLRLAKPALAAALGVTAWLEVDSDAALCYTEGQRDATAQV